jgi:hypothetical protein
VLWGGVGICGAGGGRARGRHPSASEGFVVRSAGRIPAADYPFALLQWVRPGHDRTPVDPAEVNEFA